MTKKFILCLVLAVVMVSGVFAQSGNIKNWISGEVSLLGAGVRYEYMLKPNISIGGSSYWNTFFLIWSDWGIDFSFRYYPGKIFYFGVGAGFHQQWTIFSVLSGGRFGNVMGLAITPEVGWKIDVGSPGGFFVSPGMKLPISLGVNWQRGYYGYYGYGDYNRGFGWGISFIAYVGLGYAW